MSDEEKKYEGPNLEGPAHAKPYPVERGAPAIELVDLARRIEKADVVISSRVQAQLEVIARQIRSLQTEAREVLERARRDLELHEAECLFQRRPGHVYHLYRRANGRMWMSMLSPEEWGTPPDAYVGSYRLEPDQSWTPSPPNPQ